MAGEGTMTPIPAAAMVNPVMKVAAVVWVSRAQPVRVQPTPGMVPVQVVAAAVGVKMVAHFVTRADQGAVGVPAPLVVREPMVRKMVPPSEIFRQIL